MIKTARTLHGVVTTVYQMDIDESVEWHKHGKPHTLEVIRGGALYEIWMEGGGSLIPGQAVVLPEKILHRFVAMQADTIALTMMEISPGSEVFGERGGVLEKTD